MFTLEYLDGTIPRTNGIIPLTLVVDSLSPKHTTDEMEGRNGSVDMSTEYDPRRLRGRFAIKTSKADDYDLVQYEVYRLFKAKTPFYIIKDNEPYKRWKVKIETQFWPEKLAPVLGEFEVPFISYSPFAESINRVEYKHTSNFSFNNIGDETIDMREQTDTEIEFSGASEGLIIRNKTTGDEWKYNGTTTESDVILLKGVRSTKNGVSIFGDTNKKLLTFAPGWNDVEIEGNTDYEIIIRTRFYYI